MPPNSKKGKKKAKSKQHARKPLPLPTQGFDDASLEAQVYDEEREYPTSRVIKRAPNGDVIVESLPEENSKRRGSNEDKKFDDMKDTQPSISVTLDSHWESLDSEEKKNILRIERQEIFDVLRDYQMTQSCTCSVCGRRHMSMEIEMERIYETLYDMDRQRDPELDPVKFHLSMIKELQNFKMRQNSMPNGNMSGLNEANGESSTNEFDNMRDEVVKYFLSSDAVDTLKEEVVNYKQHKQQQFHHDKHQHSDDDTDAHTNDSADDVSRSLQEDVVTELAHKSPTFSPIGDKTEADDTNEQLQDKYLKFAKTFVSSHPKIAEEYVSRMMMYPDMRALTDDLMNNNGQEFVKAIEDFVMEKEQYAPEVPNNGNPSSANNQKELDLNKIDHRNEAREYTTIKHNGEELTAEEYNQLQRMIANSIVNSYDRGTDQFREISPIERELFTRFIYGEDKKAFRNILGQTYNDRMSEHDPDIDISLAAAATTTASPGMIKGNDGQSYEYVRQEKDARNTLGNNDFNETYDEYSDYDHEDDEDEEEEGADDEEEEDDEGEADEEEEELELEEEEESEDIRSELDDEEDGASNYSDGQGICTHAHTCSRRSYANHDDHGASIERYENSNYRHAHDMEAEHGEEEYEDDEQYDSVTDEAGHIEEGRKLIQIAITKLLQSRIMDSYHERQAEINRLKLLQELEAEEQKKKAKEEKKHKKREKEKEKKKAQQLAKEEENRRKQQEAEQIKKEAEEREIQRREAQRKKVEEAKRKKDEEKKRKLEDQRRREEEQERQRKIKEEQKRKRDEEKKIKDEEKRKRDEDKRRKEQIKEKEEQEKKLSQEMERRRIRKVREDTMELINEQKQFDLRKTTQPIPGSYSNSPNMPYGCIGHQLSNTNPHNINDDIMNIISSASSSKPIGTSPSRLNELLQTNDCITNHEAHNSSLIGNGGSLFNSSNRNRPSNFSSENIGFDPLSCIHPSPPSAQDPDSSLTTQNFVSSWNSFGNKINSSNGFQHTQHNLQHPQTQEQTPNHKQQNETSPYVLNGTDATNENYFNDEIDSLAKILNSAALNDPSAHSSSVQNQQLLWGSQRGPVSISAPHNGASLTAEASHGSSLTLSGLDTPNNNTLGNTSQQNSIWGNSHNTPGASTTQGDVSSLSNSLDHSTANYLSSNIWGNTASNGISFLSNPNNISESSANSASTALHTSATMTSNDDVLLLSESIYETYVAFCPAQTNQYIPTDLLHQNSLCRNFDYATFIAHLMQMRNSHGCEILTDSSGSITHARMSGALQTLGKNDRTLSKPHDHILNDIYASHSQVHRDPQHLAVSGVNSTASSQIFPLGQHPNPPSSISGQFWS